MGRRVSRRTQRPRVRPGEGWAPSGCALPMSHHDKTSNLTIPDRSPPGSTRTAPPAVHQDGGVKHATGTSSKIRGRDNITTGTWDTRTLRAAGKLQELIHKMDRYKWNILGLFKNEKEELWRNNNRGRAQVFFVFVFCFVLLEKRINTSMALDFLFTRTS